MRLLSFLHTGMVDRRTRPLVSSSYRLAVSVSIEYNASDMISGRTFKRMNYHSHENELSFARFLEGPLDSNFFLLMMVSKQRRKRSILKAPVGAAERRETHRGGFFLRTDAAVRYSLQVVAKK
jgi:hypothetical protein